MTLWTTEGFCLFILTLKSCLKYKMRPEPGLSPRPSQQWSCQAYLSALGRVNVEPELKSTQNLSTAAAATGDGWGIQLKKEGKPQRKENMVENET